MKEKQDAVSDVALGGYVLAEDPVTFNEQRPVTKLTVINTGDRPVQVGSHFHFFEANKELEFDRKLAFGKRLNIAATTAIRFEPGDVIDVEVIPFGGKQTVYGFNNLVDGWAGNIAGDDIVVPEKAMENVTSRGFKNTVQQTTKK
ncbi:urease subunit beta [Serratia fonticola]|uniref:urease subunit beta n=1 Tax=Serratia fonticola TaxID=47917 RepID=UPI001AEB78E6|nr:urease subunit beta [Serratia fonticola]MBP0997917.1 urease subunit beta [Serratia fonticola]MBP1003820.1 urease subunit beta [Serratia fonticola]MBP1013323.1 urease subunit beta [Serratia fonticola]MBP1020079.1 urease subunit beta [Serratia fonticola]CAI1238475.1 Urease subunit beta [Serratia fonticola]